MEHCAHIRLGIDGNIEKQTVSDHCRGAAAYAYDCLKDIGLGDTAYLSALLHDVGKCKKEFDTYLNGEGGARGSVNHTFAGCRLLMEKFHGSQNNPLEALTSELMAVAIASHHGLFDLVTEDGKSGFIHRLSAESIGYKESRNNFLKECADEGEIMSRFSKAVQEVSSVCEKLVLQANKNVEEYSFLTSMLSRLLLSAVIEGDRTDTAAFMNGRALKERTGDLKEIWASRLTFMEEKLERLSKDTPIAKARGNISDICRIKAELPGGVYRLNVPTGGGKTLSSLRYALAHAQKWNKKRLIFMSPLLSILEQNASVIREYLGDDSIVTEHHSNVLRTEENGELDLKELAVENWESPVIITTLVQFLNTLFEGKTTSIRRFQALCNSIIVIDEVQTVPAKMLSLFNMAINFLSSVCGATIVLCSATQPCFERTWHPLRKDIVDIVPYDPALWTTFDRTELVDAGSYTLSEIAELIKSNADEVISLLVVCNKKDQAEWLFNTVKTEGKLCFHLSASMCQAHRRDVVKSLYDALERKEKCICISTQVIEAGVDVSFERVIRLTAGMDNIIQAAGRCNRHGEATEAATVYIVSCLGEKLSNLPDIKKAKDASMSLMNQYSHEPESFDYDLSSDKAIAFYYEKLYRGMSKADQEYYVKRKDLCLFDLMACNTKFVKETNDGYGMFFMNQALRTAGQLFSVFDNNSVDVVVPYGDGKVLIEELAGNIRFDPAAMQDWVKRARPWTVSIYDYQLKKLGSAVVEYNGVAVLAEGYYNNQTGLGTEHTEMDYMEV